MSLNPIIVESLGVHFRSRQYRNVHIGYVVVLAVATIAVWPGRGFMDFFATGTVPSSFEATAIIQLLLVSALSLYSGLDRLGGSRIIRYSEWLERTTVPVGTLVSGKIASGLIHSLVLLAIGAPFLFISAGPAGIPVRAVLSTQLVTLLVTLFCRTVGQLISLVGEQRDLVRIVGSWLFMAAYYLATIRILQPLNPIIAVSRQQNEESALVSTIERVPLSAHPAVTPAIYLLAGFAAVTLLFALLMVRYRSKAAETAAHA